MNQPELNLPCVCTGGLFTSAARSLHPGGVQGLLGDGSVAFLNDTIKLDLYKNLATVAGLKFMAIQVTSDFLAAQNKLFRAALLAAIKTMAIFENPLPQLKLEGVSADKKSAGWLPGNLLIPV